jgi:hypothetical protein
MSGSRLFSVDDRRINEYGAVGGIQRVTLSGFETSKVL